VLRVKNKMGKTNTEKPTGKNEAKKQTVATSKKTEVPKTPVESPKKAEDKKVETKTDNKKTETKKPVAKKPVAKNPKLFAEDLKKMTKTGLVNLATFMGIDEPQELNNKIFKTIGKNELAGVILRVYRKNHYNLPVNMLDTSNDFIYVKPE